jgi:hypothetical protein
MQPAAIIYPSCVQDIQNAIKYAQDKNIGIAIRTGGHQYSGASSCSGDNIQLDLSHTFKEFEYSNETKLLRCGVSLSLLEFTTQLRKLNMFLPTGMCAHVHIGGHVLSGGYGQLTRAHGLLSDHVQSFEIVCADQTLKVITKQDELFWAVFGGSPGNFGVLTHVTFAPLHDADYPNSRGMKLFSVFSQSKMQKVVEILAELSDNENWERDWDVSCTVMGATDNAWYFEHKLINETLPRDEDMLVNDPLDFGEGLPDAEAGKINMPIHPALITVWVQWANVKGQEFAHPELFERFKSVLQPNYLDEVLGVVDKIKRWVCGTSAQSTTLDYTQHTPMSKLTGFWIYDDVREFNTPYEKRAYVSTLTNLSSRGRYPAWISQRVASLIEQNVKGLTTVCQLQPIGGANSMFTRGNSTSSHSWRSEIRFLNFIDCFYETGHQNEARAWACENDVGADQVFRDSDKRLLAFSYGDLNLANNWKKYFDSRQKVENLQEIKKRVDPCGVFTANAFGIAAKAAKKRFRETTTL